jgi:hypothetical protein
VLGRLSAYDITGIFQNRNIHLQHPMTAVPSVL